MFATLCQYDCFLAEDWLPLLPGRIVDDDDTVNDPDMLDACEGAGRGRGAASLARWSCVAPTVGGESAATSPSAARRKAPVISDRAMSAATPSRRDTRISPAVGKPVGVCADPGCMRLSSSSTTSRPRPWMNCMT